MTLCYNYREERSTGGAHLLLIVDLLVLHLHLCQLAHKCISRGVGLQQVLRQVHRLHSRLGCTAHYCLCQLTQGGCIQGGTPSLKRHKQSVNPSCRGLCLASVP